MLGGDFDVVVRGYRLLGSVEGRFGEPGVDATRGRVQGRVRGVDCNAIRGEEE